MTDNAGYFATTIVPNFYANNAVNLNANEFGTGSRPDGGRAYARIGLPVRLRPETHAGSNNPAYFAADVPASFLMSFPSNLAVSLRRNDERRVRSDERGMEADWPAARMRGKREGRRALGEL